MLSGNYRVVLLSSLELHLGLIAACLPFITPALAKLRDWLLGMAIPRSYKEMNSRDATGESGQFEDRTSPKSLDSGVKY